MRAQLPLAPDILTQDQEIDLREHVEDGLLYGSSNGYPMQVTARIMLSLHAPASSIVSNKIFCVYIKKICFSKRFFYNLTFLYYRLLMMVKNICFNSAFSLFNVCFSVIQKQIDTNFFSLFFFVL